MNTWKQLTLASILLVTISACGGGSSSSDGGPPPIVVQSGFYEGTLTIEFFTDNQPGEPETGPFELSVSGVAPTQQVLIRYREFSGTSSVGANQEFRIPSGRFPVSSGVDGVSCEMLFIFDGRFVGTTASGALTGDVVCQPNNVVINLRGTFEASLALSKAEIGADIIPDFDLGFNLGL